VAKYESPSGKKIQDEGVTPNVVVASGTGEEAEIDEEAQPVTTTPKPAAKKPSVQVDEQLTKALDLLKSKTA
jgi:carboxyl-terminal processing protease